MKIDYHYLNSLQLVENFDFPGSKVKYSDGLSRTKEVCFKNNIFHDSIHGSGWRLSTGHLYFFGNCGLFLNLRVVDLQSFEHFENLAFRSVVFSVPRC